MRLKPSDLQPADLLLVRGKGFISESIEEITHSCYSHVAGYIGGNQLIEAEGFRKTGYAPLAKYFGMADVFRCLEASYDQREQIVELAKHSVGGHYDYVLLGVELIRYEFGVLLPYKEPPNIRVCSTLWSGIYKDAGLILCPGVKYPSPGDDAQSKILTKIGSI